MGSSEYKLYILQTAAQLFKQGVRETFRCDVFSLGCRRSVWRVNLVRVCDYQGPLLREVVIEVGDDLNGNICLSGTWWSNNLETRNQ